MFFFFTISKSDKKHKFSTKFAVIRFLLGCLNLRPRNSKRLKIGVHNILLQINETFPLFSKICLHHSLIGLDHPSILNLK